MYCFNIFIISMQTINIQQDVKTAICNKNDRCLFCILIDKQQKINLYWLWTWIRESIFTSQSFNKYFWPLTTEYYVRTNLVCRLCGQGFKSKSKGTTLRSGILVLSTALRKFFSRRESRVFTRGAPHQSALHHTSCRNYMYQRFTAFLLPRSLLIRTSTFMKILPEGINDILRLTKAPIGFVF